MRMFLYDSRHNSELSIASHSSRSTVSQLRCLSEEKTKMSTVIYAPFIKKANQMASRLTTTTNFPRVFYSSCNFQLNVQAFWLTGLL